jgi:hypothetical protein
VRVTFARFLKYTTQFLLLLPIIGAGLALWDEVLQKFFLEISNKRALEINKIHENVPAESDTDLNP